MNMYWPEVLSGPSSPRRRAFYLALGAVLMLVGSWAVAAMGGVAIAALSGLFAWLAAFWMVRQPLKANAPEVAPPPAETAAAPDAMAVLRHDVRGMLSPALMIADRLVTHEDPVVARAGDVIARTVQRVTDRLDETKSN